MHGKAKTQTRHLAHILLVYLCLSLITLLVCRINYMFFQSLHLGLGGKTPGLPFILDARVCMNSGNKELVIIIIIIIIIHPK